MKGQDPLVSSSSRREISPAPEKIRSKSIGCMSGIFQFAYKYHDRRRFLTFVKKHGKDVVSSPKPTTPPSSQPSSSSSSSSSPVIFFHFTGARKQSSAKILERYGTEKSNIANRNNAVKILELPGSKFPVSASPGGKANGVE
ncbi:hypothetical protein OIU79_013295 [Salix purpurea]|uniref:Uncharacterized protein n=1 Tax=Salix purpurea TaxID=77065 RepID=A0A9Q0Q5C7_SALPP|nr:hypothetical protein OIU79_013295 [Salix purpurea]